MNFYQIIWILISILFSFLWVLLLSRLPSLFFIALLSFLPMGGQYICGGVFPLYFIAYLLHQKSIYENFLTAIREKDSKKRDKDAEERRDVGRKLMARFYHHISAFYVLKGWLIYISFAVSLHLPLWSWGMPDFRVLIPALVWWILVTPLAFEDLAPDQRTQMYWAGEHFTNFLARKHGGVEGDKLVDLLGGLEDLPLRQQLYHRCRVFLLAYKSTFY